ncbi:MAG: methylenetetrahydrofolate reductase, partial [Gammaproteobacteria bacterium]|nr:methylenetetrahydrofolate reductase [Gammaproteobacteria bacterium]
MSNLEQALASEKFVVTCELNPPKGTDVAPLLEKADQLRNVVDAFNLTDSHAARMAMTPLAVAHLLVDQGLEPILQITTRDRNRIALQGDLLGADALGVHNVVFMGGDPPSNGDHPDAKPVFDVYSSAMLKAATSLQAGTDMAGNPLSGRPRFCIGAVVNPGATDLDEEIMRMAEKIDAGATFFQTQAV